MKNLSKLSTFFVNKQPIFRTKVNEDFIIDGICYINNENFENKESENKEEKKENEEEVNELQNLFFLFIHIIKIQLIDILIQQIYFPFIIIFHLLIL